MPCCRNCLFWTKEHPTAPGWRLCEGVGAEARGWCITGDERECDVFIDKEEYELLEEEEYDDPNK